jgi:hypothetical protein
MPRGARAYVERNGFLAVTSALLAGSDDDGDALARLVPELGSVYCDDPAGRMDIEQPGHLDEVVVHVSGIVQAAAREVIARCSDELALFGRDREALRNIAFARITHDQAIDLLADGFPQLAPDAELNARHEAVLAAMLGPCVLLQDGAVETARLLLPGAGRSARAFEHATEVDADIEGPLHAGAVIDMARVALFLIQEEPLP